MNGKSGISVLLAVVSCVAAGGTVTLAPAAGVTTNAFQLFTGDTAVEIAGPGTVALLNPANSYTGGTTLSGGTLELSDNIAAGDHSPVGAGTLTVSGGTLRGSGTFARDITGTGAVAIEASDGWAWAGGNTFSAAATVADGTLEIVDGETTFRNGLTVAAGASVSVTGGTLGFNTVSGAGTIAVDGGTLANSKANGSARTGFEWISASLSSLTVGAAGLTFTTGNGSSAGLAQIKMPIVSTAAGAGVTFKKGDWGYYAYVSLELIAHSASLCLRGYHGRIAYERHIIAEE